MTGPDSIAALAAQLEELRGQLARHTGETGYLRARLEEDSGQVLMLRLEIKKLGGKLDAAIARRQADEPPAPYWMGLDRDEAAARLGEVRGWVEQVARVQWPGNSWAAAGTTTMSVAKVAAAPTRIPRTKQHHAAHGGTTAGRCGSTSVALEILCR